MIKCEMRLRYGKIVLMVSKDSGIGNRCKQKGVPVIALVGGMGEGADQIYEHGVDSILPTINGAMEIDEALERANYILMQSKECFA